MDNYNLKNTLLVNQRSAIPFDQIRSYKIRLKWQVSVFFQISDYLNLFKLKNFFQRAIEIIIVCNKMTANARLLLQSKNNNNQRTSRFDPVSSFFCHLFYFREIYENIFFLKTSLSITYGLVDCNNYWNKALSSG